MRDDYVDKIINWPAPKTPKELSSFLGFTGYYRTFLPEYSKLTCEMDSQKRKKTLEWTEEMDNNFKTLKDQFGHTLSLMKGLTSSRYGLTSHARVWGQFWNKYKTVRNGLSPP